MRLSLAIAACVGVALAAMTSQAFAQSQTEPYQSSSRLLVLKDDAAPGVRVLRGSAAPRRAAAAPEQYAPLGPGRYEVVGGERFWMFDRQTGKLASCINRLTSNVGEREIECNFGTLSRYRRTFGNNFRH